MLFRACLIIVLFVFGGALPVAIAFQVASEGSSTEAYDLKVSGAKVELETAELERLVDRLGANKFQIRQQASKKLEALVQQDFSFADTLRKYESHPDLEVRLSVKEIIAPLGIELDWIDPANEPKYSSGPSTYQGVSLDFKNVSKQPIKIFWIDLDGKRQAWRTTLQPGKGYHCERTFEAHVWLVTDVKEKALGLYVVGNQNASVVFRGLPKRAATASNKDDTRRE